MEMYTIQLIVNTTNYTSFQTAWTLQTKSLLGLMNWGSLQTMMETDFIHLGMEVANMTEHEIKQLLESNFELSMMLLGNRSDTRDARSGNVTYLFGRPLNEICDILLKHESEESGVRSDNV
jgi:hypothetical protein